MTLDLEYKTRRQRRHESQGDLFGKSPVLLDQIVFSPAGTLATWDKTIIVTQTITGQIIDIRVDWGSEQYHVRRSGVDNPPAPFAADGRTFEIHVWCSYQYIISVRCGVRCEVWNPAGVLVYDYTEWPTTKSPGGPYLYFSRNIGALGAVGNWRARITFMSE